MHRSFALVVLSLMSLVAAAEGAVIAPPSFHVAFEAHAAGRVVAPSLQGFGELLGTADSAVILAKFSALSTAYRTNPALLAPAILKLNPTERDEIMSLTAWVPEKKLRLLQRLDDARLEAAPLVARLVGDWLPAQLAQSGEATESSFSLWFHRFARYEGYLRNLAALYPHADIDDAIEKISAKQEAFRTAYLGRWGEEGRRLGLNSDSAVAPDRSPIHPDVYEAIAAAENVRVVSARISMNGLNGSTAILEVLKQVQDSAGVAPDNLETDSKSGTLSLSASGLYLERLIRHPAVTEVMMIETPHAGRFLVRPRFTVHIDRAWGQLMEEITLAGLKVVSSKPPHELVVEGDWDNLKKIQGKHSGDFAIYPLNGR